MWPRERRQGREGWDERRRDDELLLYLDLRIAAVKIQLLHLYTQITSNPIAPPKREESVSRSFSVRSSSKGREGRKGVELTLLSAAPFSSL